MIWWEKLWLKRVSRLTWTLKASTSKWWNDLQKFVCKFTKNHWPKTQTTSWWSRETKRWILKHKFHVWKPYSSGEISSRELMTSHADICYPITLCSQSQKNCPQLWMSWKIAVERRTHPLLWNTKNKWCSSSKLNWTRNQRNLKLQNTWTWNLINPKPQKCKHLCHPVHF